MNAQKTDWLTEHALRVRAEREAAASASNVFMSREDADELAPIFGNGAEIIGHGLFVRNNGQTLAMMKMIAPAFGPKPEARLLAAEGGEGNGGNSASGGSGGGNPPSAGDAPAPASPEGGGGGDGKGNNGKTDGVSEPKPWLATRPAKEQGKIVADEVIPGSPLQGFANGVLERYDGVERVREEIGNDYYK